MKLIRKEFLTWKNDIYIIPTFRVIINNLIYGERNLEIEFHWLTFHARLLWVAESEEV